MNEYKEIIIDPRRPATPRGSYQHHSSSWGPGSADPSDAATDQRPEAGIQIWQVPENDESSLPSYTFVRPPRVLVPAPTPADDSGGRVLVALVLVPVVMLCLLVDLFAGVPVAPDLTILLLVIYGLLSDRS